MSISISLHITWWWALWVALSIWFIVAFMMLWLQAAFAGLKCLDFWDVVMIVLWPLRPVIGFLSVFWN